MKIAVVTESFLPQVNGVTNSVLRVLETLRDHGHEALVIAPEGGDVPREYAGHRVKTINSLQVQNVLPVGMPMGLPSRKLLHILDGFAPDVLHIASPFALGAYTSRIAKRLKEFNPAIQIIGVDPIGSILGGGDKIAPYLIEGIGYDFFPDVLNNDLIDAYVKTNDADSFRTARQLIREEGLLVGGSSGAAMWGALQAAKTLTEGQKCLVILPDSIRNYMSKFASDDWMHEQGMM